MAREYAMAPPGFRYLSIVTGLFVATLLVSNIAAQKLIPVGPFVFTGGILLFPITYIFGDVLTECYGYAKTRQAIWAGFAGNALLAVFLAIVVALPPAPDWPLQREFAAALATVPRIVIASLVGYWVGEFANSYVLARMKVASAGRRLWMRTIASTAVGQAADTICFVVIAFAGLLPPPVLLQIIWSGYLFKVAYEGLATPLTYVVVRVLKRAEGIEVFDKDTNFNPFRMRAD